MASLALALLLGGCLGSAEHAGDGWTATTYREQYPDDAPPGCLVVCVVSGVGCAMAGPDGEHEQCAYGLNPVILDNGSFGTCVLEAAQLDPFACSEGQL
ncbi:MAG TPA: hypothetical protein VG937_29760 [Polyangiaceae bacterium]|nr:hypothetical protein [Polyangiaceae bacterium]